ncbi:MAG: ribose-phosphate diphosphokinase [Thermoplasmatota archaeon]
MARELVVAGSASGAFAEGVARALGSPLARREVRRFPDGEAYVRILDDVKGAHVVVVQSTAPDPHLVEMLLWQDAAWEAGASRVTCIIPYLGYARQDRAFEPGEAISSRAAARAVGAGCDRVVTVDPHKEESLAFFGGKATCVSAVPVLADCLKAWGVNVVLAPDRGARQRAQAASERIGARSDYLEKTRLSPTEVRISARSLDVHGARVAILDDLIASGATVLAAAQQLKAQGAQSVVAACTHGLFTGGAAARLLAGSVDRLLITETIAHDPPVCDVVPVAAVAAGALMVERAA